MIGRDPGSPGGSGEDEGAADVLIGADERHRKAVAAADSLRAEQKVLGKQVGRAQGAERDELLAAAKQLAADVKAAEAEQASAEQAMDAAHRAVPNLIIDGVPAGGEDDFVVLKHVGTPAELNADPRGHVEEIYCRPEDAQAEHERLLAWEERMLALIEVPYRVIDVAAGDLGSSAARKYDCEAWIPSQRVYRELTSTAQSRSPPPSAPPWAA